MSASKVWPLYLAMNPWPMMLCMARAVRWSRVSRYLIDFSASASWNFRDRFEARAWLLDVYVGREAARVGVIHLLINKLVAL